MFKNLILFCAVASASAKIFSEDASIQKYMWETFKREHGKVYNTASEEATRFNNFLVNLKSADSRNDAERASGGSATHGITKFTDLSQSEFASRYLNADTRMRSNDRVKATINTPVDATSGLVDWTGKYTTPVKNQVYWCALVDSSYVLVLQDNQYLISGILRLLLGVFCN